MHDTYNVILKVGSSQRFHLIEGVTSLRIDEETSPELVIVHHA